jgi:hypothetical protein
MLDERRGAGMADSSEIHRELGSLLAQVESLNREMRELKADVKKMRDDFASVKGGSRVLIGIAAFFGSGLTWGLTYFFGKT